MSALINVMFISLLSLQGVLGVLFASSMLFGGFIVSYLISFKAWKLDIFVVLAGIACGVIFLMERNIFVIYDYLRFSSPILAYSIGRRLGLGVHPKVIVSLIIVSCFFFFTVSIGEFFYAFITDMSEQELRKFSKLSPFGFLFLWFLVLSWDKSSGWLRYRRLFIFMGATAFILLQSRTVLSIFALSSLIYIAVKARFKGILLYILVSSLIFFLNYEFLAELVTKGFSEFFYNPSIDGESTAIIYNNWRGFEIYSVLKAMSESSVISWFLGQGVGSSVPLGFTVSVTESLAVDSLYQVHSLYFEILYKFGLLGLGCLFYVFYKMVTDKRLGKLYLRLILVAVMALASLSTSALIASWLIFIWWGYQSRSQDRTF